MTLIIYFTKATNNFFFYLNIWTRRYSTASSNNGNIQPIVVYENSLIYKAQILKDNQGKAAIYRWVNKVNGKSYIGSTFTKISTKVANFSTCCKFYKTNTDSTKIGQDINFTQSVNPVVTYSNAELYKVEILKENKNKAGIYRWVNKLNGNTYVGSAVNLKRRLYTYFNLSDILRNLTIGKSRILSVILRDGYSNFQLEILEYCSPEDAIKREQYYIDLLKPEYNLNPTAGSRLGTKHFADSLLKMSASAKGRKLTEDTKNLLSLALKGTNNHNFGKTLSEETKAKIREGRIGKSFLSEASKAKMSENRGTAVKVLDLITKEQLVFTSIKKAAEFVGVTQPTLSRRFKNKNSFLVKKRYQVEK